jgi:hypothetical protein
VVREYKIEGPTRNRPPDDGNHVSVRGFGKYKIMRNIPYAYPRLLTPRGTEDVHLWNISAADDFPVFLHSSTLMLPLSCPTSQLMAPDVASRLKAGGPKGCEWDL